MNSITLGRLDQFVHHKVHANLDEHHKEHAMMHSLLFGLIVCGTGSALTLAVIDIDPTCIEFIASFAGGLGGAICCYCLWKISDLKEMARTAIASLILAIIFGPGASEWIAPYLHCPVNIKLIVPVSGTIGMVGGVLIKALGPKILDVLLKTVPAAIFRAIQIGVGMNPDEKCQTPEIPK